MAKTEKELKEIREKVEELNSELSALSEEELEAVTGGLLIPAKGPQNGTDPSALFAGNASHP